MKKSNSSGMKLDFMDLGLLGAGNIGAGVVSKAVNRFMPTAPPQAAPIVSMIGGYLLTKAKDRKLQFAGLGLFSRGLADTANSFGIGEDAVSDALELEDPMEAELAAELAAEMEAEMEAELANEVSPDGSY